MRTRLHYLSRRSCHCSQQVDVQKVGHCTAGKKMLMCEVQQNRIIIPPRRSQRPCLNIIIVTTQVDHTYEDKPWERAILRMWTACDRGIPEKSRCNALKTGPIDYSDAEHTSRSFPRSNDPKPAPVPPPREWSI